MDKETYNKLMAKAYEKGLPFIVLDTKDGIIWVKNISVYHYDCGYYVEAQYRNRSVRWLFTLDCETLDSGIGDSLEATLHIPDPSYVEPYNLNH